jgi:M6 family metalloprotease-like protein
LTVIPSHLFSAPVKDEPFALNQPDGSLVNVIVSGDEFYQDVRTPDGYPLIRDPQTQWICYAQLSADQKEWVSTGIVYNPLKTLTDKIASSGVQKFARLNSASIVAKRKAKFFELNRITYEQSMQEFQTRVNAISKEAASSGSNITPPISKPDTVYGFTILIDFPDQKSAVPIDSIQNWLNFRGYTGYRNNGSIHDYFYEVSDGKMVYFNKCTPFITADNPKTTYDAGTGYNGAYTLINEICVKLKNLGTFDFNTLTITNGYIRAVNILYAGSPSAGWANGLWPHSGSRRYTFTTGVSMNSYMLSNLGTSLSLGTFVHENGHMLCKWPDLYAYDDHDNGAGGYCIMCVTGTTNPVQPCGFLRTLLKWITVTNITNDGLGHMYSHVANSHSIYQWSGASNNSSAKESYYIEARRRVGRSQTLPDSGLLIWHVDLAGDNTTKGKNDYCVPEQADGLNELEKKINNGKDGDLFHAGYKSEFNDNTTPLAKWHNNANSGVQIANISAVGATMTFSLGPNISIAPDIDLKKQTPEYDLAYTKQGIRYTVPKREENDRVTINLYNLNGTLAKNLLNGIPQSGRTYFLGLCARQATITAGTYLCVLTAKGVRKTITIVLE